VSITIDETISTLISLGGESAAEHHEVFADCLVALLGAQPAGEVNLETYRAALKHGFSYYYWKWDPRAWALREPLIKAISRCTDAQSPDIDLICELLDFLFFVVWCFEQSSTRQSLELRGPMHAASLCFTRTAPPRHLPPLAPTGPHRVAWLAMYAEPNSPMSVGLRQVAPALRAAGHELHVYGWRFSNDEFRNFIRREGGVFHELGRETPEQTIFAVEAQAARDKPAVVISDMNNAVPTALFSRRLAPVQIFLQAGMPAWPTQNLDAVFNSFGFDSEIAGWGKAEMLEFNPPWDLPALDPSVNKEDIAAERANLPQGLRLIGSYGRLAKVTEPYLKAAEQVLIRCEDAAFIIGGTGDKTAIEDFIARSPVGARMQIEARFVPGHVWGHFLDVLLDTWPVTGGESCREMVAKGKPVVTLHSEEMPAIDLQRDGALVMQDWNAYSEVTVRLLQDPSTYSAACQRARELASTMSDVSPFANAIDADIAKAVRAVRWKRSLAGRGLTALQTLAHARTAR
jgi:hypothetical protein